MMLTSKPMASLTKKGHAVQNFSSSWPREWNVANDSAISITWCQSQWCHMMKNNHDVPHFDCLDWRNAIMPLMMLPALCDTDISTNSVTWPKMSCWASFILSWPKEWNGSIDDAFGITWSQYHCHWCHLGPHFEHLYPWITVIPLTMLFTSHELRPMPSCDPDANGIMSIKSHFAPHFICLKLRNRMMPLMMLAPFDTDASSNCIQGPKSHVTPHFDHLDPRNAIVPLTTLLAWCQYWCQ